MDTRGPLDALRGKDGEMCKQVIGVFLKETKQPMTMGEWAELLDSRKELISASKHDIFMERLGQVRMFKPDTLMDHKPTDPEGVLNLRGLFFREATSLVDKPNRLRFVGIDTDNNWLMTTVWFKDVGLQCRRIATNVQAEKTSVDTFVGEGIDPLDLFRWMDYWLKELREHRLQQYLQVLDLEFLFAAQSMCLESRVTFREYCDLRLTQPPV